MYAIRSYYAYEMVLRYAHLAPEHLADAAARIEKPLETVANHSVITSYSIHYTKLYDKLEPARRRGYQLHANVYPAILYA